MSTQPQIAARLTVRGSDDVRAALARMREQGVSDFRQVGQAAKGVGDGVKNIATQATSGVRTATAAATVAVSTVGRAVAGFQRGISAVIGGLNRVAAVAGISGLAIAGGFGAAYEGLRRLSGSVSENIERQLQLSRQTGVSVEALSRWQSAVRIAGGNADSVAPAFQNVYRQLVAAAEGSEDALRPFQQLGLEIRNADGSLKSVDQILTEVTTKLGQIENPGLRAKAAFDLMGSGAADMLPLLERGEEGMQDLLSQADAYGTSVTEEQAREIAAFNERSRRFNEAVRGVRMAAGIAFQPFFTESAERMADWLRKNSEEIRAFIADVGKVIESVNADLRALFAGDAAAISSRYIRALAPGIEFLRDLFIELFDAALGRGRLGSRIPWLDDFARTFGEVFRLGREALRVFTSALDEAVGGLPSFERILANIGQVLRDVRTGLAGAADDVEFPWARRLGSVLSDVIEASTNFGTALALLAPTLIGFADDAMDYVVDAFEALRQIIQGEEIDPANFFSFLNVVIPTLQAGWERIKKDFEAAFGSFSESQVQDALITVFNDLSAVVEKAYGLLKTLFADAEAGGGALISKMDGLAKILGLDNWRQLGIVLAIGYITGLDSALQNLVSIFANLAVGALAILGIFGTLIKAVGVVGGWFLWLGVKAAGIFGGIAAAWAVGIAALTALIGYGVYWIIREWDQIVEGARSLWRIVEILAGLAWDAILAIWSGAGDFFGAIWESIKTGAGAAWDFITGLPGKAWDALVSVWEGVSGWFGRRIDDVREAFGSAWDFIGTLPGVAWDALVDAWGGLVDFFRGPIDRVKGMFADLWGGVKDGAAGAWNSVRRFFGFGGDEEVPAGDGALPSFDVGGYVPGAPGEPMKAIVHGRERILNLGETALFERIMGGLAAIGDAAAATVLEPQAAAAIAGAPVSAGGGSGGKAYFDLNGRRAEADMQRGAVRTLGSAMRRAATASSGRAPRWMGGYA